MTLYDPIPEFHDYPAAPEPWDDETYPDDCGMPAVYAVVATIAAALALAACIAWGLSPK